MPRKQSQEKQDSSRNAPQQIKETDFEVPVARQVDLESKSPIASLEAPKEYKCDENVSEAESINEMQYLVDLLEEVGRAAEHSLTYCGQ